MSKIKKDKINFVCSDCGANHSRWMGQCNTCKAWNTITEFKEPIIKQKTLSQRSTPHTAAGYSITDDGRARKISETSSLTRRKITTGMGELDRVYGGGITESSVSLLSGDPGAGKTTLLSQLVCSLSHAMPTLYASAEESSDQLSGRINRLGLSYNDEQLHIMAENILSNILDEAIRLNVKFLVIDSIQSIVGEYTGIAGSIAQVKGCTQELNIFAKSNDITLIIIGHVTKDKSLAGPKTLEHIVDALFHIEVNDSGVRMIRPSKNRYGDIDTVGIFTMTEKGMISVDNPSLIFITGMESPGSAIACIRDGNRNLLLEVQSLVTEPEGEFPQRVCLGLNLNRLKMLTAVLKKHGGKKFYHDMYVNLIGGIKLPDTDTSADLALIASLISSLEDKTIPRDSCFMGEISLSGECRPINAGVPRVKEAIKHGFKKIYLPKNNYHKSMEHEGVKIIAVTDIKHLLKTL